MSYSNRRDYLSQTLIIAFLLVSPVAVLAGATEKELQENWMAVYLQGQRIGYAHSRTVEKTDEERTVYVSNIVEQVSLSRGATTIRFTVEQEIVEDKGGRLVSFSQKIDQGPILQVVKGELKDGKLLLITGVGAGAQTQTFGAPAGLCPWAAEQVSRAKGFKAGTTYQLPVFLAEAPTEKCIASVRIGEKEDMQVFEISKGLTRVEIALSSMPGVTTVQWFDDDGQMWLSQAQFGGFRIELRKVAREVALQPAGSGEIMLASGIEPDRPIQNPRTLKRLVISLALAKSSASGTELPSDLLQNVTRTGEGFVVSIMRAHGAPEKSYRLPYSGEEWKGLLKTTPWLEVTDPLIVQMSKEAIGDETDALKAARRIEKYVNVKIRAKTLGLGFATAAETARQSAGDCTEHAVLVAALARAAGMPSRVVSGLAYGGPVEGEKVAKFYFHMWAEVYVGEWLPLDAALGSHDATHIALARSGLESPGDALEIAAANIRFLGTTTIKVIGFEP